MKQFLHKKIPAALMALCLLLALTMLLAAGCADWEVTEDPLGELSDFYQNENEEPEPEPLAPEPDSDEAFRAEKRQEGLCRTGLASQAQRRQAHRLLCLIPQHSP